MQGDKVGISKGKFTLEEHDGNKQEATYEADTTKKPHEIDFKPTQGKDKGKVHKGIFIFEESLLKLCLARPGDDRPTEASSEEGSGHILLVLEPAKSNLDGWVALIIMSGSQSSSANCPRMGQLRRWGTNGVGQMVSVHSLLKRDEPTPFPVLVSAC